MNEPAFGSTLSSPSECHPHPARFMPIGLLSFSTFETTSTSGNPGRLNSSGSMMCSGPSRRVNATCCAGVHLDAAEEQDAVPVPRGFDLRDGGVVDRAGEIDADGFRRRKAHPAGGLAMSWPRPRSKRCGPRKIIPPTGNRVGPPRSKGRGQCRASLWEPAMWNRRRTLRTLAAAGAYALIRPSPAPAQPRAIADPPDPVDRRAAAGRRPRQLDHVQRRRRPGCARRLRRGDAQLRRRGRPDDRLVADVRLVAGGHRLRAAQGGAHRAHLRRRQGLDVELARPRADRAVAPELAGEPVRSRAGPQSAQLAGALADAVRDEGRGSSSVTSASRRRKGGVIARSSS